MAQAHPGGMHHELTADRIAPVEPEAASGLPPGRIVQAGIVSQVAK